MVELIVKQFCETLSLVKERNRWKQQFENGERINSLWLQDYETNRESELWRSTKALEELCEYILFLERKLFQRLIDHPIDDTSDKVKNSPFP